MPSLVVMKINWKVTYLVRMKINLMTSAFGGILLDIGFLGCARTWALKERKFFFIVHL